MSGVSVVIPSLNAPLIDVVVAAVERQDESERLREVLVVGRDEPRLLRERALPGGGRVRLLDTRVPASEPRARNLGLAAVESGLLIFLDSDCVPQPGWLRAHVAAHERLARDGVEALVCGGVRPDAPSYWALVYNLALFWGFLDTAAAGPRPALPTLNLSFARALARRVGAFDEYLPRATTSTGRCARVPRGSRCASIPRRSSSTATLGTRCARCGATARAPASTRARFACDIPASSRRRSCSARRVCCARCRRWSRRRPRPRSRCAPRPRSAAAGGRCPASG